MVIPWYYKIYYSAFPQRAQARFLKRSRGVPTSYYQGYFDISAKAAVDDDAFGSFKSHPDYMKVLEQPKKEFGTDCLKRILARHRALVPKIPWQLLHDNDQIGRPTVFDRRDVARKHFALDDYHFSSTTLRYAYLSLEMLRHAKCVSAKRRLKFLEIGGGYGGQCWILHNLAPLCGVEVASYTIIDVKGPSDLQKRYLKTVGLPEVQCVPAEQVDIEVAGRHYDFLIANYSLGEFPRDIQERYLEGVVRQTDHGYINWNLTPLHPLVTRKRFPLLKITREIPRSGPSITVSY